MQNLPRNFFMILCILLQTACSLLKEKYTVQDQEEAHSKVESINQSNILCKYSSLKGIAELIEIHENTYSFVFFPGNVEFSVNKNALNTKPIRGKEFRALYEELIDGNTSCLKSTPQLINLPH